MARRKTLQFRTELEQLLDIIVHSLYSEREIFLRELISNASDAIDKLRFEALTRPELLEDDDGGDESRGELEIEIEVDREAGTLTVSDNGIGLSPETIVETLGTIARSGTQEFLKRLREAEASERPELIGQFGVGFYSAFMVADEVTVLSRAAGDGRRGVRWTSKGDGKFTIEEIERAERGTDVVLHLREDAHEFLDQARIRQIVKKYSDFIAHPVVMEVARTEGEGDEAVTTRTREVLNSRKALWLRSPDEVEESEYHEFYRQIAHDTRPPAKVIHFAAEGTLEYRALLYIPEQRPIDFFWGEPRAGLQLYVQRVFIMDRCEDLLPLWLRFVHGVVDSSDLPLNVSREMLQRNRVVGQIRKGVVNKVLRTLEDMKKDEGAAYEKFFEQFGVVLKEGVAQDFEYRDRIARLLLFASTRPGEEWVDLPTYVERMAEGQEAIWYLTGERREQLERSPYLEALREKGEEVLLLTDPVDEFLVAALGEFEGKPLRAVDRGALESEALPTPEEYEGLFTFLKTALPTVKEVRPSRRLRESAAVLVADEGSVSAHLQRVLRRLGREGEAPERELVLELNVEHPAVRALRELYEADRTDPRVEDMGRLLYDEAVLAEGSPIDDPAAFAARVNALIEQAARA